jgi:hypothetical protein
MWTNTEKTKNEQHEPHQKPGINSGALAWKGSNSCSTCGISHVAHGDNQSPVNDVPLNSHWSVILHVKLILMQGEI